MDENEQKTDNTSNSTVNTIRIKKNKIIEQIIDNILTSKRELGVTLFPYNQFFKSYMIEIKHKYLVIDSLIPFYGNKILPKTEYIKINAESNKHEIDRHFLTKYKDEIILGEEHNFLVYKPEEIVLIEKRSVLRVSTNDSDMAYVYILYKNNNLFCIIRDLSWNSISFTSEIPIETYYPLKNAMVKFFNKTIRMDLRVIHSTYAGGKYQTGCSITKISDNDRDLLINFMLGIERKDIRSNLG